MLNNENYLSTYQWMVYEERDNPSQTDSLSALAYQDSFIRWIIDYNDQHKDDLPYGIIHIYPLKKSAVLLGAKDTRLKEINNANQFLKDKGYDVVVRPHGGLAVINDPGIINIAMVSDNRFHYLSIDQAYEKMVGLVRESLSKYNVEVDSYEIPDSYCPGKYDLVVNGLKIGGIAQRRFKSGITTAAYISVNGDQVKRAETIQTYYRIGEADASYPQVSLKSMTTIQDVIGQEMNVDQFEQDLKDTILNYSSLTQGSYHHKALESIYKDSYSKLARRSEKVLSSHLP